MGEPHDPSRAQPARTDLATARAAVAPAPNAREAWRLLAAHGLIPPAWVNDVTRRFAHGVSDEGTGAAPHPRTVEECALFAADVEGVLAAETLARELVARLAPWGAPSFGRALWWALGPGGPRLEEAHPRVVYMRTFLEKALYAGVSARDSFIPPMEGASGAELARAHSARWGRLVRSGARIVASQGTPKMLVGRAFSELPNPFEPLAKIFGLGYATPEYLAEADGGRCEVVLIAPSDG